MSIATKRSVRKGRHFIEVLGGINQWATARIAAGDLDFDDVIYRTRDASAVLLSIWDEKEEA